MRIICEYLIFLRCGTNILIKLYGVRSRWKITGHVPINRSSPRFPSRSIPSVPPGDAIRRRVGRGGYRLPPDGEGSGEKSGESQMEYQTWSSEQKSCDDFYRISRYSPIGGGDYGCPALSPRGGGFASSFSFSFSFSSFLVLALDCYPPPPLHAERWRSLLPIQECSGRHLHEIHICAYIPVNQICRSGNRHRRYLPRKTRTGRPA